MLRLVKRPWLWAEIPWPKDAGWFVCLFLISFMFYFFCFLCCYCFVWLDFIKWKEQRERRVYGLLGYEGQPWPSHGSKCIACWTWGISQAGKAAGSAERGQRLGPVTHAHHSGRLKGREGASWIPNAIHPEGQGLGVEEPGPPQEEEQATMFIH